MTPLSRSRAELGALGMDHVTENRSDVVVIDSFEIFDDLCGAQPSQNAVDAGLVEVLYLSSQDIRAAQLLTILTDKIRARNVRRLVLDSASRLETDDLEPAELPPCSRQTPSSPACVVEIRGSRHTKGLFTFRIGDVGAGGAA